jgi:hypothetical protein
LTWREALLAAAGVLGAALAPDLWSEVAHANHVSAHDRVLVCNEGFEHAVGQRCPASSGTRDIGG